MSFISSGKVSAPTATARPLDSLKPEVGGKPTDAIRSQNVLSGFKFSHLSKVDHLPTISKCQETQLNYIIIFQCKQQGIRGLMNLLIHLNQLGR